MCAHGSMAGVVGRDFRHRLPSPGALRLDGAGDRAPGAGRVWAGGATHDCRALCDAVTCVYVKVRGEMFLSFGVQVQQLL